MYSESERSVSNVALSGTMRTERFAAFSLRAICEYILCVFPVPARPMMKLTFAGIFPSCVQNFENYPHFIAKLWIISPKNELTVKINMWFANNLRADFLRQHPGVAGIFWALFRVFLSERVSALPIQCQFLEFRLFR